MRLRILTYNIHGLPWIPMNLVKILQWMFTQPHADIICLQELWSQEDRKTVETFAKIKGWNCYFPHDPSWIGFILQGICAGSGLCILTNPKFQLARPTAFTQFTLGGGVDALMPKGYYMATLRCEGKLFNVVNTHLQSDFTEFPCCRVNYLRTRKLQEMEIYNYIKSSHGPSLIIGDMNTHIFKWFERVDPHDHITFPETEEHLDHLICLATDLQKIRHIGTDFYDDVDLSDHIPIVFEVEI